MEDGDVEGGEVDDEAMVVVEAFTEDATADVENEENIGFPTIVALFTSLDLASFE